VRRGDTETLNHDQHTFRYVEDDYVQQVLDTINKYINVPAQVNIHSDSFLDMSRYNTYDLEVNTCFDKISIQDAMNEMISCDLLFRKGVSAFSGVCAFYNTNLVISDVPEMFKGLYEHDNVFKLSQAHEVLKNYF
jgi:hypothetical protein